MDAANDDDSSAYRLLGWPIVVAAVDGANTSTSSVQSWENCNDFDAFTNNTACAGRPPPPAAHSWQADDTTSATTNNNTTTNGDWLTLQFQIRTTNNGLSIFRRAMQILYSDNHTFQPSTQPTSWQWKLKGYFRLIQCALERRPEATPAAAAAAIADSTTSTTSLSEDGWEKMAIELLKRMNISLQQYLMELLRVSSDTTTTTTTTTTTSNATSNDSSTTISSSSPSLVSITASTVVLPYLQSILTIVHPYVQHRIRLLGPTYRSVCELSTSFVALVEQDRLAMEKFVFTYTSLLLSITTSNTTSEGEVTTTPVAVAGVSGWKALSTLLQVDVEQLNSIWKKYRELLEQMTHHLLGFLDEGLDRVQLTLLARKEEQSSLPSSSSSSSSSAAAEKQSKIIVFLLARITSLITMAMSGTCQFAFKDGMGVGNSSSCTVGSKGGGGGGGGDMNLMSQFILRLIRTCHLSLLAQSSIAKEAATTTHHGVGTPYLRMVEELRPRVERYLVKVMGDFESKHRNAQRMGLESFIHMPSSSLREETTVMNDSLAKLHLMKVVMKKLVEANLALLVEPTILIQFYQSIIFVNIPQCHQFFQSGCNLHRLALEIIQELVIVLEKASHLLYRSAVTNETPFAIQQQQQQQHYLLVRWLSPVSDRNGRIPMTVVPNHPLANEVLLHILHRRILLSCALEDRYSLDDASHLLSLLTQLLFHQHTETSHRRNIATLLTRLLSSSGVAEELTSQSLWRSLKHAFVLDNSAPRKRQRKPIAVDISSPTLAAGDLGIIRWVLEVLALSRTRIDYEIASEMRQFWDEVLGEASAVENHVRCSRDVDRATWLLSLSIGVMKSSSTLAEFFHAFGKDGDTAWTVSPRDFTERVLSFIQPTSSTKRNKSSSASARHVLLTTVCIQLLGALSQCVGIELPEVHVDQIGNFLRDAVVTASDNVSVHAIGLQYCALSTVSKLGSSMRSNFVEATLKPLAGIVNHLLDKESWYYISPTISSLNYFVQALPNNHKGIVKTIPSLAGESSLTRMLFTSRLKGVVFSITSRTTINLSNELSLKESRFLIAFCCRAANDAWCHVGDKSILLKSGSKVIVHRDENGDVIAMTIAPVTGNKQLSSTEILSAITNSKFDVHSMSSSCEMKLSSPKTTTNITSNV